MRDYNKTEKGRSFHATYWTSAKFRETRKRWEAANREQQNLYHNALAKTPKGRARLNSRKSRFKQATPPWVDRAALRAIYAACPPGYEVDHAVPLQGALVSGLHVPWNLQYLLMSDNRRKSNQHDYEVVADDH
jgi:5-methylcytosine-specific restriction endonuclease McrA